MPRPRFIFEQLDLLRKALEKEGVVCEIQRSRRRVPMLLVDDPTGVTRASVCYFGKSLVYRCFHPWKDGPQQHFTSAVVEDVVRHVKGLLP